MSKIWGYKALDSRVLAVATLGPVGDWSAYIGAVPGEHHDLEAREVAAKGSKLSLELASIIFPTMAAKFKWRA